MIAVSLIWTTKFSLLQWVRCPILLLHDWPDNSHLGVSYVCLSIYLKHLVFLKTFQLSKVHIQTTLLNCWLTDVCVLWRYHSMKKEEKISLSNLTLFVHSTSNVSWVHRIFLDRLEVPAAKWNGKCPCEVIRGPLMRAASHHGLRLKLVDRCSAAADRRMSL